MRKDKTQQKMEGYKQLRLFEELHEPAGMTTDRIGRGTGIGVDLYSRLERQRTLTVNILEKIVDYGNVNKAYQQVRVNSGSGGVDGMDVLELRQWIGKNYRKFCKEILNESYEASPVRKVEIQKGNGGTRILGIPTVKDRLIQQAISQEPILRPLL